MLKCLGPYTHTPYVRAQRPVSFVNTCVPSAFTAVRRYSHSTRVRELIYCRRVNSARCVAMVFETYVPETDVLFFFPNAFRFSSFSGSGGGGRMFLFDQKKKRVFGRPPTRYRRGTIVGHAKTADHTNPKGFLSKVFITSCDRRYESRTFPSEVEFRAVLFLYLKSCFFLFLFR